jgi:hypothetical protein
LKNIYNGELLKRCYEEKLRWKQPSSRLRETSWGFWDFRRLQETQGKTTMTSVVKSHEVLKPPEVSWSILKPLAFSWKFEVSVIEVYRNLQVRWFPLEESSTTETSNFLETSWHFLGLHNRSLSFSLIFCKKTEHYRAFKLVSPGSVVLNRLRKEQAERILMLYEQ